MSTDPAALPLLPLLLLPLLPVLTSLAPPAPGGAARRGCWTGPPRAPGAHAGRRARLICCQSLWASSSSSLSLLLALDCSSETLG
jgi:hypothetical protein